MAQIGDFIEKRFKLSENNTTVSRELIAGATTFVAMCYIIFVQPIILKDSLHGASPEEVQAFMQGVFAATCIASAIATILMAFMANYPIALRHSHSAWTAPSPTGGATFIHTLFGS